MAYRTTKKHFEGLARRAVEALPEEFGRLMTNVSIVVEDYPSKEEASAVGVSRNELLGLFEGATQAGQDPFFGIPPPLPDMIILYQRNIEALCYTEEELLEEIRTTLLHEAGHYFGLSEEDLEKYE